MFLGNEYTNLGCSEFYYQFKSDKSRWKCLLQQQNVVRVLHPASVLIAPCRCVQRDARERRAHMLDPRAAAAACRRVEAERTGSRETERTSLSLLSER